MKALSLDAAIPQAILIIAQEAYGPTTGQETYNYYLLHLRLRRQLPILL
jgi:hypothetical protein